MLFPIYPCSTAVFFCPVFKIPSVQFLGRLLAELFLPERRLSFTLEKQSSFFTPHSLFLSMGNRSLTGGISPRHLLYAPFCRGDSQSPHALWPLFWWSHLILLFEKKQSLDLHSEASSVHLTSQYRVAGGGQGDGNRELEVGFKSCFFYISQGGTSAFISLVNAWDWRKMVMEINHLPGVWKLIIYLGHSRYLP